MLTVSVGYGKKLDPALPVLNLGTNDNPRFYPAEHCRILPGQPIRSRLTGEETTVMLNFACRSPFANARSIVTDGRGILGYENNPVLRSFGLSVDKNLITVHGRELQAPTVLYGKNAVQPSNGSWNLRDQKVSKVGRAINRWSWIHINPSARNNMPGVVEAFGLQLKNDIGLKMSAQPNPAGGFPVTTSEHACEADLDAAFKKASYQGIDFLLVVIGGGRPNIRYYGVVKALGDVYYGIHTSCVVERTFSKAQAATFANIALKWNLKVGGNNHVLKDPISILREGKTMIVGYDVTHPTNMAPGKGDQAPSLVGLVASVDKELGQWPAVAWEQESRQEMLGDKLQEVFRSRLELWRTKNSGRLPQYIVIYRDGVSEGQFSQVLEIELPKIRKACETTYRAAEKPKISIIVSVKRHQTRFYPTNENKMDQRSHNIRNGTVVDRGVTQAKVWDFFLAAHTALQGMQHHS
jgi:eukaryotic translation initiation factor 2C